MRIIIAWILIYVWYLLFQFAVKKWWDKSLDIKISCNRDFAYEGDELELIEEIENDKWLMLPGIKVKFATSKYWDFCDREKGEVTDRYYRNDVFSVGGYRRMRRVIPFVCKKRGYYEIGDADVFATNFFYTREYFKRYEVNQRVYVFAKRVHTPDFEMVYNQIMGEVITQKKIYEDPYTFLGIRDYQSFDRMKQINWKATAKAGTLKVNSYMHTGQFSVHLLVYFEEKNLELNRWMEEYLLSLTATLAERFLQKNIPVSFACNGYDRKHKEGFWVESGAGEHHLRSVDEAIARIELEKGGELLETAEDFFSRAMRPGDLNLVLSTCQMERFQQELDRKKQEGFSFVWLHPHYETDPVHVKRELMEQWREIAVDFM